MEYYPRHVLEHMEGKMRSSFPKEATWSKMSERQSKEGGLGNQHTAAQARHAAELKPVSGHQPGARQRGRPEVD